jgi:hypothetical protein
MKRELGWLRSGSGLVLSLLFLMSISACTKPLIEVKVDAQCGPNKDNDNTLPTGPGKGTSCRWDGDTCTHKPDGCVCRK